MSAGDNMLDAVSPNSKKNYNNRQVERQKPNKHLSSPFANQENQNGNTNLLATSELPNADSKEFIASELCQITNQNKDNKKKQAAQQKPIPFEGLTGQPKEDFEQHLESQLRPDINSPSPPDPFQYMESKEDENWEFTGIMQSPSSGSLVGSSIISTPSVDHDVTSDKRESSPKLQKTLEKLQKSWIVAEQPAPENQQKWTAWQEEMEQHYTEEMQKIKDKHASEQMAHKETLQKTLRIEIGREKARLMQEFNSRISQEVTKACKKQEFRIKQLSRMNFNLRTEKQGQEVDMEAYRNTISSQEEELLRANKKMPELFQSLDKRNREIEMLHAKIGNLEKTAKEAISQVERTEKELEKTKRELETTRKDCGLDPASDAETVPGSTMRAWASGKRISKSKNQELNLKIVTKELAEAKAIIETQGSQNNELNEEILRLRKSREEDDTVIKNQRRKIHSLEGLPPRIFALSESIEHLNDELQNLSQVEEQDKAIIRQQQNEIEELVDSRAKLKGAKESLDAKQATLNDAIMKLEHDEVIIRQQQNEIEELVVTKTKLEGARKSLDSTQTALNETFIKLERDELIIMQQQNEIEELMLTRAKLKEAQESLDTKQTDLIQSMTKVEQDKVIIRQQQIGIEELVFTRARLKGAQESLNTKQTALNDAMMKLEHDKTIIWKQQKEIHDLANTRVKLKEIKNSLTVKQADLVVTKAELKETQERLNTKQTDLNETRIKRQKDKVIIEQQQKEIQDLEIKKANELKEMQKSLHAKHTDLEKSEIKLEQANDELQNPRNLHQEKKANEYGTSRNILSGSNRGQQPALIDGPTVPLEPPKAVVSSTYFDTQKKNRLHGNNREVADTLLMPKNNNNNNNNNNNKNKKKEEDATPRPQETRLLGAQDIDILEESEDDDGFDYGFDYDDDNDESLHKLLEMAVAGGAAILRKLEKMRSSGL